MLKIEEWKQTRDFEVGVNQFSDLTWEEFTNSYLMKPIDNELISQESRAEEIDIDWREKKIVTDVKD